MEGESSNGTKKMTYCGEGPKAQEVLPPLSDAFYQLYQDIHEVFAEHPGMKKVSETFGFEERIVFEATCGASTRSLWIHEPKDLIFLRWFVEEEKEADCSEGARAGDLEYVLMFFGAFLVDGRELEDIAKLKLEEALYERLHPQEKKEEKKEPRLLLGPPSK